MSTAEAVFAIVSATVPLLIALASLLWWAYKRGVAAGEERAECEAADRPQDKAKIEALERQVAETRAELASLALDPAYRGSTELRRRQQQGEVGHAIHEAPDEALADRLSELVADLPAMDKKTGELSSEPAREEPGYEVPHTGPQEESSPPAGYRKKRIRSLLPSEGLPHSVRIALGFRKRNVFRRTTVLSQVGQETVSHDREQEAPNNPLLSPIRPLPKPTIRLFGWMIPSTVLAVLQRDHNALQEEALRFIETEINQAYTILGPPPGLEGPALGGQLDVERD